MTERIEFYRVDRPWGELSSLWPAPILFEVRDFLTVEHAYQYGKFKDPAVAEIAMRLPPSYIAVLAHGLFGWQIAPGWSRTHLDRMLRAQWAKYQQHADLSQKLLETETAELVERSSDTDWGINKLGHGRNYLGLILMVIRARLRQLRGMGSPATIERVAYFQLIGYAGQLSMELAA